MARREIPTQLFLHWVIEYDVHGQRHVLPPLIAPVAAVADAVVYSASWDGVLQIQFNVVFLRTAPWVRNMPEAQEHFA